MTDIFDRNEIDLSPSENGRLKAAISQLALVKGVKVAVTQPNKKVLNGVYLQRAVDSRHEGWPRFESPDGMHLFRCKIALLFLEICVAVRLSLTRKASRL